MARRVRRTPQRWARLGTNKWHVTHDTKPDTAACGQVVWGAKVLAKEITGDRCNSPACRRGWPALLRLVS